MRKISQRLFGCLFAFVAMMTGATTTAQETTVPLRYQENTPAETRQLVFVYVPDVEKTDGIVSCIAREDENSPWKVELGPMKAQIGRNGFGNPGEKEEGNGKLPAGEWDLAFAYGFAPEPPAELKIPYRQITDSDFWVDESTAPEYNHWVSGPEPAVSHESLTQLKIRYNIGLVTLYNVHPTNPGKGSAIFLHVWLNPENPTAGCVALDRDDVVKILQWLDSSKRPRIRTQSTPQFPGTTEEQ